MRLCLASIARVGCVAHHSLACATGPQKDDFDQVIVHAPQFLSHGINTRDRVNPRRDHT